MTHSQKESYKKISQQLFFKVTNKKSMYQVKNHLANFVLWHVSYAVSSASLRQWTRIYLKQLNDYERISVSKGYSLKSLS
jgi:hypothetical protein